MLTVVAPSFPSPVPLPSRERVWCECAAYSVEEYQVFGLGGHLAGSAWGAVLWLSWRASRIAEQLDAPAALTVRAWLTDDDEAARATARLADGWPYAHVIGDGPVRYVLSAVPQALS